MKWKINARRAVASTLGIYGGFYGVEHGYFETLQGNVAPSSIVINAIGPPCQPNMQWYGCERAITVIPNFFVTGVLAIIVSLTVMIWAAAFVQRKNGGVVLILLSIMQLLVGGGIGPILPNLVAGVAGTRIDSPLTWWRTHLSVKSRRFLAKLWPWSLIATLLWLPGEYILGYFFGVNNPILAPLSQPILGLLLLTFFTGLAYDTLRGPVPDREVCVRLESHERAKHERWGGAVVLQAWVQYLIGVLSEFMQKALISAHYNGRGVGGDLGESRLKRIEAILRILNLG